MLEKLKQQVYEANMQLTELGLVNFTWGNVSGIDRQEKLFVIKPSGVAYKDLCPDDLVVVDLKGNIVEGKLRPSSDTPTHIVLYNHFPEIKGIAHTHSPWAVSFAAAGKSIPELNTTHADTFNGDIPITRELVKQEIQSNYEENTGKVIVETLKQRKLLSLEMKGILVNRHGPFTWGIDAKEAVYNAKVLEIVAEMDYHTMTLSPNIRILDQDIQNKHYLRKHGENAYYGQVH
ncbi:L-ribulose-5-phosphate 4-epimerase [Ligilactobacillus sp. WILCCON 0076]|uniref:L-ribulose-5-phosphate 4-epimerase n=1 Tax=Ligilactobacillus ubinensis TaxID=2876789 RepID=A0A9X2FKA0_9LACO|nr:L-ribulose-5-phosphate 4-epimerase [Ligilactobacillus ubinensis]MCP0886870.1 L-ribulose-5-phosphate 4-epimerase [Ligilactobacillus ubinensis]